MLSQAWVERSPPNTREIAEHQALTVHVHQKVTAHLLHLPKHQQHLQGTWGNNSATRGCTAQSQQHMYPAAPAAPTRLAGNMASNREGRARCQEAHVMQAMCGQRAQGRAGAPLGSPLLRELPTRGSGWCQPHWSSGGPGTRHRGLPGGRRVHTRRGLAGCAGGRRSHPSAHPWLGREAQRAEQHAQAGGAALCPCSTVQQHATPFGDGKKEYVPPRAAQGPHSHMQGTT